MRRDDGLEATIFKVRLHDVTMFMDAGSDLIKDLPAPVRSRLGNLGKLLRVLAKRADIDSMTTRTTKTEDLKVGDVVVNQDGEFKITEARLHTMRQVSRITPGGTEHEVLV